MAWIARRDDHPTLLIDGAGEDWAVLCGLDAEGTIRVRGSLPPPPSAGTARALWAGWGPAPGNRPGPAQDRTRLPWLVAHDPGDLRIWVHTPRRWDGRRPLAAGEGSWWFTRPLPGVGVGSAAVGFDRTGSTVYVPYLVAPGDATTPELRVLWFRTRWRDEPAAPLPGATALLQAAAWDAGEDHEARMVLVWRDPGGGCRWGLWRRWPAARWVLEGSGDFQAGVAADGGGPPWRRVWLVPLPGGGARAIALPGPEREGKASGGGSAEGERPRLVLYDFPPRGAPRAVEYRLGGTAAPGGGRTGSRRDGSTGALDLAGWWTAGRAALVLLWRRTGDGDEGAEIEGWLLDDEGATRCLGRVATGTRHLRVARVSAACQEAVTPCHVPLWVGGTGAPRPWPVPAGWLDALRLECTCLRPAVLTPSARREALDAPAHPQRQTRSPGGGHGSPAAPALPAPRVPPAPAPAPPSPPPVARDAAARARAEGPTTGPEPRPAARPTLGAPARPPLRPASPGTPPGSPPGAAQPRWRTSPRQGS